MAASSSPFFKDEKMHPRQEAIKQEPIIETLVKHEPVKDCKTSPPHPPSKPTLPPNHSVNIKKTYLQAFAQSNTEVMNTLNLQVTDKKSVYIPKSSLVSRDHSPRSQRIVVIGVPQDPSTATTDKCLDFLASLRVISPADKAHMKCITERTTRTHKRVFTVSFDDPSVRQQILQKNVWTNNPLLPTWGISVFPDHTFRERKTTLLNHSHGGWYQ
jgi:hypothetical protein